VSLHDRGHDPAPRPALHQRSKRSGAAGYQTIIAYEQALCAPVLAVCRT
jgi:hypothetical protein